MDIRIVLRNAEIKLFSLIFITFSCSQRCKFKIDSIPFGHFNVFKFILFIYWFIVDYCIPTLLKTHANTRTPNRKNAARLENSNDLMD